MISEEDKKIHVNFIFRKQQHSYYSVERVFADVKKKLSSKIIQRDLYLPYFSRGIFDRIRNIQYCRKYSKQINHITGDVNYLAAFLPPQSTVLTILDCVYQFNTSGFKRWFIWFFWYYLPVRKCRHVTAISEFSKQETVKITGVNPAKIQVIYVALPEGFEPYYKVFNSECPVILHVGNSPNKNLNNLILALNGINCELWVVGSLTDENILKLKDNKVRYQNYIGLNDAELIDLYRKCDIVSFVSLYEGFGMPVIEGQAIGRPVITSNRGSLPEVAGEAALVITEPEEPEAISEGIRKIISNSDFREQLIAEGFENVKRFDCRKLAAQYEEIYTQCTFR